MKVNDVYVSFIFLILSLIIGNYKCVPHANISNRNAFESYLNEKKNTDSSTEMENKHKIYKNNKNDNKLDISDRETSANIAPVLTTDQQIATLQKENYKLNKFFKKEKDLAKALKDKLNQANNVK